MRISAPLHFEHASLLPNLLLSRDPRRTSFVEPEVELDLRGCEFVRPAAVLWCVIYPLLALSRGSVCRLLVPENMGVCVYLKSLGLFPVLQSKGIEVDDRGIPARPDPQIVLPLTAFTSEPEVDSLANRALEALNQSGLGAANLHPIVSEIFAELALNAVQHSESPIGAYGFIQFYDFSQGKRFVCGVADGGIGVRQSLEKNPSLRSRVPYDWAALELAVRERISSTGDKMRGIGLYGVAEDMRQEGRKLVMHSGIGALERGENLQTRTWRTVLFPGTLAHVSIPT